MKHLNLFVLVCTWCITHVAYSQCAVSTIAYTPGLCTGNDHTVLSVANVACVGASYMQVISLHDGLEVNNFTTPIITQPFIESITPDVGGMGPGQVCHTYIIFDDTDTPLDTAESCLTNFWDVVVSPFICQSSGFSNCGSYCFSMSICGGQPPYSMEWNNGGNGGGPGSNICFNEPGIYTAEIVDQLGCMGSFSVEVLEVWLSSEGPTTCETATQLTSGVAETDTICSADPETNNCSGFGNMYTAWYHINSGSSTHINVGANMLYATSSQMWITVYEMTGADCSTLEQVYCDTPGNFGNCFDLADYITIQPNTEYYFQVSSALGLNWQPLNFGVILSDETEEVCGCTVEGSCDYNPTALINTFYNCGTAGCTDASACNYQSWAACDNGTCIFGSNMNLQIFHDTNGDGIMQTGTFGEDALGGIGYITIVETGDIAYANGSGQIVIPNLPLGTYTISFTDINGAWQLSPGADVTITLPSCSGLNIGLSPTGNEMFFNVASTIWNGSILPCNPGFNPGLVVSNTGNTPLNGTITLTFDDLLVPSLYAYGEPYDNYSNSVITWYIEDQMPGTTVYYQCHIAGPGAAYVGQSFNFDFDFTLVDENEAVVYTDSYEYNPVVTCSYDPNDKQALPVGYSDPHFILTTDEIEYRIRFQNTGNAAANDVMIADTLDVAHLDLSTFYPVAASHSYSTIVDTDGHVQFVFNNINLPDSTSDEPSSHGFVTYRITPLSTLQGWDEILNTAHIYFDDNEAVVTNSTIHTIYDCAWLNELPEYDNTCVGTYETLDFTGDYIESYVWTVDGVEQAGNAGTIPIEFDEAGDYTLGLTLSNPLCSLSSEMPVTVHPNPEVTISYDVNTGIVTAPEGYYYSWYLFGDMMMNENENTFDPWQYVAEAMTVYVVVTDQWGCSGMSNVVTVTGVSELNAQAITLYPNPITESSTLKLPSGIFQVQLFNSVGQKVNEWNNIQNTLQVSNENLSSGAYLLRATNQRGDSSEVMVVVE
ncbi:MAG: T9SS type A sorting domain-containing protein [Flavobacteriales bacterium]